MAVVDPHYLWAAGHVVMLLGSGEWDIYGNIKAESRSKRAYADATLIAYVLLQLVLFRGTPAWTYRLSYSGALLSYAIVVIKSLGMPSLDQAWIRRAFVDENVQYMFLAFYWWISKPVNRERPLGDPSPLGSISLHVH